LDYDEIDKIFADFGKAHAVISLPASPAVPVAAALEPAVAVPPPGADERKRARGKGPKKA
jgi:hypothetical protein